MALPTLVNLDHVEVAVEPWSWPFATARRADIDAHFADLRRRQTPLWNGRALMLHSYARLAHPNRLGNPPTQIQRDLL
jgi:hypothetical protein